jgi:hypothetical protein
MTIQLNHYKSPGNHTIIVNANNKRLGEFSRTTFQEAKTAASQAIFNYLLSLKENFSQKAEE